MKHGVRPGVPIPALSLPSFACFFLIPALCLLSGFAHADPGQETPKDFKSNLTAPRDVIVLVVPETSARSRIGLVYRKRISDERARQEVRRLEKAAGGKTGANIEITNESIDAKDLKHFPITTGVNFTLQDAPLVVDSAPNLLPFLTAFQSWDHIEVIFAIPDLSPYKGVENYEIPDLTVQLLKDPGVYRYDIDIREHNRALSALPVITPSINPTPAAIASAPRQTAPWSIVLLLFVALTLAVSIVGYFVYSRRAVRNISARSLRH